ncbi:MAG: DUF3305 domain-containing protein [Alphaproteobacteria bacterium]|nr:MAG: DUF3305 domain-containing protein [Alphaproteobacteria bacterium]
MPVSTFPIGVVIAKRPLKSLWADHEWLAVAVLPEVPPVEPWTRLPSTTAEELYFGGALVLEAHTGDTAFYRDNLAGTPTVWVSVRPNEDLRVDLVAATVDPYEGESLADNLSDRLEALPMPDAVRDWLAAFVATHHVERPFFKRQRQRQDPESLGRRGRVEPTE